MDAAVLFSGGKDSALAALSLDRFYDVTLVTGTFGITDDWRHARRAADRLDYPFRTVDLDPAVADDAAERMRADGYPRNGIQRVHEHALERVAALDVTAVADGTRRDDRVPTVDRSTARSLEDRRGVDYLAPLAGVGRGAVDRLVDAHLTVRAGPSEALPRADYEAELRAHLADRAGPDAVASVFPAHEQTVVRGRHPATDGDTPK
jgi:predicted subunit of tRNA(5-methylaminomethyl-2-thiouridylate) methyltransferase